MSKLINDNKIVFFRKELLKWYVLNKREFPWREKSAPNYELIISEIFLQRTKAETVARFLPGFFKKYPDWTSLSDASEQELQTFIKPLGLYRQRGTRLYKLAQELRRRKGHFPKERTQVEEMPMMGQYITNAYELYILKKRAPLLDVNMARILERFFEPRKLADIRHDPNLQTLAYLIVDHIKSKELNWAILDYASLICRTKPYCKICIINSHCNYFSQISEK